MSDYWDYQTHLELVNQIECLDMEVARLKYEETVNQEAKLQADAYIHHLEDTVGSLTSEVNSLTVDVLNLESKRDPASFNVKGLEDNLVSCEREIAELNELVQDLRDEASELRGFSRHIDD